MVDVNALRRKFHELWLSLYPHTEDAELNPVMPDGGYLDNTIDGAWLGFQLGHAAGMEDAAVVCTGLFPQVPPYALHLDIAYECADAIRAQAKGEKP